MFKRVFDIVSAVLVLLVIWPLMILIAVLVLFSGRGGVFFVQQRVGRHGLEFNLYKFRTMQIDSEALGQLTIGIRDPRVTQIGYWLRKFKLDELPQLFNVIGGSMSVVGPRPEVIRYTSLYSNEQRQVLNVRPGLTDYASLIYIAEDELLGEASDPLKTYVDEVMPAKLALNLKYIKEQSFITDLKIIFKTIGKLFS